MLIPEPLVFVVSVPPRNGRPERFIVFAPVGNVLQMISAPAARLDQIPLVLDGWFVDHPFPEQGLTVWPSLAGFRTLAPSVEPVT